MPFKKIPNTFQCKFNVIFLSSRRMQTADIKIYVQQWPYKTVLKILAVWLRLFSDFPASRTPHFGCQKSTPGIQIWTLISSYGIPYLRCTILEDDQLTFQNSKSFKPMMIIKHIKNLNQNPKFQNQIRCFHTSHYDCRKPILIQIWRKRLVYINGEVKMVSMKKYFWNIWEMKIPVYRTFIIIST